MLVMAGPAIAASVAAIASLPLTPRQMHELELLPRLLRDAAGKPVLPLLLSKEQSLLSLGRCVVAPYTQRLFSVCAYSMCVMLMPVMLRSSWRYACSTVLIACCFTYILPLILLLLLLLLHFTPTSPAGSSRHASDSTFHLLPHLLPGLHSQPLCPHTPLASALAC